MIKLRHAIAPTLLAALLAGCGGGSSQEVVPPPTDADQLLLNQTLTGFPHKIDLYVPKNPTRVVIFLHGGGGSKEGIANSIGLISGDTPTFGTVNWSALESRGIVAVVPQGQNLASAPNAPTWSNYVMDSGVDDVAFLKALVKKVHDDYGSSVPVSVVGHSNGAMMANRMWCEQPDTFNVVVALAGPASEHFLTNACNPGTPKPYLGIVGDNDDVLQASTNNWTDTTWTLNFLVTLGPAMLDPKLMGEWTQFVARAGNVCNQTPNIANATVSGGYTSWTACGGLLHVDQANGQGHTLGMPNAAFTSKVLDFIVAND